LTASKLKAQLTLTNPYRWYIGRVLIAPDGGWLAAAPRPLRLTSPRFDDVVAIWDPATGALRHDLTGHTGSINQTAIAPDGSWLVTAGTDGTARIWDTATGHPRYYLPDHQRRVNGVAIAADGSWLATASSDDTVKIWQLPSHP
jgi:WD40 repeat protein